jgi:small neutral amino acid transporter SnatA (MarC family)
MADAMRPVLSTIDRLAGRVYTRVLALILGALGTALVLTGLVLLCSPAATCSASCG